MTELMKTLCTLCGTSGREDEVRNYIINEIKPFADKITVDPMGNLIVFKKGKNPAKKKVMLDAHMDEVGFIITSINNDGTLLFDCVGGINAAVMTGIPVIVGEKKIHGVIGVVPVHLLSASQKGEYPDKKSLVIDIGASSKEEAEKFVTLGDCAYFDSAFVKFGNGFIKSKAIDDRAGCAILIEMIKKEQPFDLYFTFSTGEEVGLGMVDTAAYTVAPDYAIVVESTTAADLAGVEDGKKVCCLGKGAAISFMDRRTIYNKNLYNFALDLAKKNNIKVQLKTMVAGGNNAGHIHKVAGGIKTLAVSVPCRYLHSPSCVIKEEDFYSSYEIITALAKELADDKAD
ncbi:MAG: M42 family peptidase [Clostridia bacterium]|nr:M42 family peptidase [Clostridia bacterium]MCQ2479794.1 M42 family peptidase [Clostridia bacterium]